MATKYWLLKAEPDSRIVKGKDVKFSVDDFERVSVSPWEGVRNYEARNLMKEMQVGEKAVFYHSNCKNPGIAAFAQVAREAYPDYTSWDESHPYYDPKSEKDKPKWYMVDLEFTARAKHFIPLTLFRHIASLATDEPPTEVGYIGEDGIRAIKTMNLVTRGRLSVQRVDSNAWNIIQLLAAKGGWEEMDLKPKKSSHTKMVKPKSRIGEVKAGKKKEVEQGIEEESPLSSLDSDEEGKPDIAAVQSRGTASRKRKAPADEQPHDAEGLRRSGRRRVRN
ncbi:hypothetical protein AGABI1DRAFT_127681 [Agaricus bisporus var. burnettii JB137-S8]|uniref:EVE domain-containing protein n=2 Tax=Agaricus bisporus var. burnettii TaxID=192524 RepID=K5XAB3_AGABU|nr:uncharacterized protein AGABI1DRAFT_127681 [Agaricus bisporus var. burnettii JB137-S8]EKM80002.1 hypothetical protein AGABI1DRAFT_127681 [Agaricus bisporus var. burnettii JB137-S8]KAF7775835.1 hypothetical protein Agabi119p4_4228 [Agaricus bisporus var. burnettii]